MSYFSSAAAAHWITGPARSGKTAQLVAQFQAWMAEPVSSPALGQREAALRQGPALLVFAATGDNRLALVERLTVATGGQYPVRTTTPVAFFEAEVTLFWPLLLEQLALPPRFPLRLRPETEQALALELWQPLLESGAPLAQEGVRPAAMVRRILDLHLLAASSGESVAAIAPRLRAGMASALGEAALWEAMGEALIQWRRWCLERGLLTYGVLTELYSQYLLPDLAYQAQLLRRYDGILADDGDEYPAIAADLFSLWLDSERPLLVTYNPNGCTRLGFGADPEAMAALACRCQTTVLAPAPDSLEPRYGDGILRLVESGGLGYGGVDLADFIEGPFFALQTVSRAQLLRAIAETIIQGIQSGQVTPAEVAILGPGVDAIARHSLIEILRKQGIRLEPLQEQRPLSSAPMVRALLTLLAFVYPGLGRDIAVEQVAEMLVVLSLSLAPVSLEPGEAAVETDAAAQAQPRIDPVRAGLLADHCYQPSPELPQLLPVAQFSRWDRLGYQATEAYDRLRQWIDNQRLQQQQRLILSPVVVLDRAIQTFLWNGSALAYDQLAALRELMESAQHFWEVETRLAQAVQGTPVAASRGTLPSNLSQQNAPSAVARFIELLRSGTVAANPYPAQSPNSQAQAVTLATVFQYRISRPRHRWLFWLDVSSSLWVTTGTGLFGAGLFLRTALSAAASGAAPAQLSSAEAIRLAEARLTQTLSDLLGRATERIYLCASELSTSGQVQAGPLLALVEMAAAVQPLAADSLAADSAKLG